MSDSKKFISDISVTFISSSICLLLSFPITVVLGRYLGADDLGLYRMVSTIFGTIMLFITIGIPAAIIKYVAEFRDNKEKLEQIITAGVTISVFLGIISFIFIYLSAGMFSHFFHMPKLEGLLKIIAYAVPFSIINNVLLGFLNGLREMTKNAWISIIQSVCMLVFTFALVLNYGVNGAVIGILFSSVLTTLLLIYIQKISNLSFSNFAINATQLVNFGSKTLLSNAINLINYQADILVIGYFMTVSDVGVYSIAIMFAKLIWILPDSIQKLTFPLISEYHSKKMNEPIQILVDKCMKYSCLFLIICTSFFIFFGEKIIIFIFGMEFKYSYYPLIILLTGTLFYGITKSVGSIFASVGKVTLVYRIPLVAAISNIFLNLILIPIYGINGAAIATTVSLILSTILMVYFMKTLINIKIDSSWYIKVLFLNGSLLLIYVVFENLLNGLLLGAILIIVELILFLIFFIDKKDKYEIFHMFNLSKLSHSYSKN